MTAEGSYVFLGIELHRALSELPNVLLMTVVAAVGFVLALRRSDRPVGWLLLGVVVSALAKNIPQSYLLVDYHLHHGNLPFAVAAAVIEQGIGVTVVVLLAPAVLLLPDGRVPPGRWRWVWRTGLLLSGVVMLGQFVSALALVGQHIHVDNTGSPTNDENGLLGYAGFSFLGVLGLVPVWVSLIIYQVVSFRRSTGIRRQQMKWLLAGAVIAIASLIASSSDGRLLDSVRVGVAAFPIALLVTVFRYRLYEVDRLISRTLSYLLLTALVVGSYIGLVSLAEGELGFSSPVAVASSTLAAVALFSPLRRRTQHLVDRRFNRARIDAEEIVSRLVVTLRDTVQTETVKGELLSTIVQAIEPSHVALWTATSAQGGHP